MLCFAEGYKFAVWYRSVGGVRGNGGQTVVPPSWIEEYDEQLVWYDFGEPTPVGYTELLSLVRKIAAISLLAQRWPSPGSRHTAALALAGLLLRGGVSVRDAEQIVGLVALAAHDEEREMRIRCVGDTHAKLKACVPTTGAPTLADLLDGRVVRRVADWLQLRAPWAKEDTQATDEPDEWEPPMPFSDHPRPEFPTVALPTELQEWAEAEAEAVQVPLDLAAVIALTITAAAVSRVVVIEAKSGWVEATNLYTLTVLPPGARKSPVFKHAKQPVKLYEREMVERMDKVVASAASRRRIMEAELKAAEQDAVKLTGVNGDLASAKAYRLSRELDESKVPELPQYTVDDCTPEQLATIIAKQGGNVALLAPEGDIFATIAGQYSKTGQGFIGIFLRGHDAEDMRVSRVGRKEDRIDGAVLTVGLMAQPQILHGVMGNLQFRGRGLVGRFLYSLPMSRIGTRTLRSRSMSNDVQGRYEALIRRIYELKPLPIETDSNGEERLANLDDQPHVVGLDTDAWELLMEFHERLEPMLPETGELGYMADWASKLVGRTVRIAGVLHACTHLEQAWDVPIDAETMARAIKIGEYFLAHAKAAYGDMGSDPEVSAARLLLAWIERLKWREFTKRDLFEQTKGRFGKARDLDQGLAFLEAQGYLRTRPEPERELGRRGRKPSPKYEVNPAVFDRTPFNSANSANTANGGEP